jgi:hypothetical protein
MNPILVHPAPFAIQYLHTGRKTMGMNLRPTNENPDIAKSSQDSMNDPQSNPGPISAEPIVEKEKDIGGWVWLAIFLSMIPYCVASYYGSPKGIQFPLPGEEAWYACEGYVNQYLHDSEKIIFEDFKIRKVIRQPDHSYLITLHTQNKNTFNLISHATFTCQVWEDEDYQWQLMNLRER